VRTAGSPIPHRHRPSIALPSDRRNRRGLRLRQDGPIARVPILRSIRRCTPTARPDMPAIGSAPVHGIEVERRPMREGRGPADQTRGRLRPWGRPVAGKCKPPPWLPGSGSNDCSYLVNAALDRSAAPLLRQPRYVPRSVIASERRLR